MSESVALWIFGTLVSVLTLAISALAAALWTHVSHCKDVSGKLSSIETKVNRIVEDVGDHDHGMRRDIREHTSVLIKLDARLEALEDREELKR